MLALCVTDVTGIKVAGLSLERLEKVGEVGMGGVGAVLVNIMFKRQYFICQ